MDEIALLDALVAHRLWLLLGREQRVCICHNQATDPTLYRCLSVARGWRDPTLETRPCARGPSTARPA